MKLIIQIVFFTLLFSCCKPKQDDVVTQFPGKPEIPASIKKEHEELLNTIHAFTLFQDSTGKTAIELEKLMLHHFKEEEDYVLPPLGLLPDLSKGLLPEKKQEIIAMTEKLKEQYSHMSAEHQLIAHLNKLMTIAAEENHPEVAEFGKAIHKHASAEEEIYFPTAIVVGEFLKMKIQPN